MLLFRHTQKLLLLFVLGLGLALMVTAAFPSKWVLFFLRSKENMSAAHFIAYLTLGFTSTLLLKFQQSFFSWRIQNIHAVLIIFVCCLSLGLATEGIQFFTPDRIPDSQDLLLDLYGTLLGLALYSGVRCRKMWKNSKGESNSIPLLHFPPYK